MHLFPIDNLMRGLHILASSRLYSIDILRGLAALAVAWFHLTNSYPAGPVRWSGSNGWLGVEAFFVISGFVIPYSLHAADYRIAQFARFMTRRFIRLEPPYIASILLVIALWSVSAAMPGFRGGPPQYSLAQVMAHLFYLVPFTHFGWLNVVYWSLFFEFLFYVSVGITFPLIAGGSMLAIVVPFGAIFLTCSYFTEPPAVILLFLFGIAGFRSHAKLDNQRVFYATICGVALALIYLGQPAMALVGAATVLVILTVEFPRCRILYFLGTISYSLYLLHVPIGGRIVNLGMRFGESEVFYLALSFAALIVSIIAAALYWRFIEAPAHQLSKSIQLRPTGETAQSARELERT